MRLFNCFFVLLIFVSLNISSYANQYVFSTVLEDASLPNQDKEELVGLVNRIKESTRELKTTAEIQAVANPIIDEYVTETKLEGKSLAMLYYIKSVYGHYKPQENVTILDMADKLYPNNKWILNQRGMNKINTMAYSEAITDFEKAIELDSVTGVTKGFLTPSSYNNMALAALNKRDFSLAVKYCDEAIRINPKTYTAYAMRANIFAMQGKYSSALNDATQAKTLMVESGITSGMHLQGINHLIYKLNRLVHR